MKDFRHLLSNALQTPLCCLILLVSGCFSTTPHLHSAEVPPEEEIVNVRCYMLSFGSPISDVVLPVAAGGKIQIPIISNLSPGIPLRYHGPRLMRFYKEDALADGVPMQSEGEGIVMPPPLAEVMLPAGVPVVLLLFVPDGNEGRMRMAVLPFNEDDFGSGGFLFQNFTRDPVAINVGGQKTLTLPAMASEIYQHKGGNSREEGMVRMARLNQEGEAEIFYSSRWTHMPQQRTWVFLLPGKNGKQVDVRRFHDVVVD